MRRHKWGFLLFLLTGVASMDLEADTFNGPMQLKEKSYDELIINGPANLNRIETKSLAIRGPLKFEEISVKGPATIDGPMRGKRGAFRQMVVNGPFEGREFDADTLKAAGPVSLEKFTFEGNVQIEGEFMAKKGTLQDLSMGGENAHLEDVNVKNIVFTKAGHEKQQNLLLGGSTVVSGDITFESGHGKVMKNGELVRIQGKIIGGTLAP